MPELVLCANHRLARHLRAEHDRAQQARGEASWSPLAALTIDAWLAGVVAEALLGGGIAAREAPRLVLAAAQERLLWEAAIDAGAAAGSDGLFDREGLAALALEANELVEIWNLSPASADTGMGEETHRFLDWRQHVRAACTAHGWLGSAAHRNWCLRALAAGAGRLPASIAFAGFDRHTPQEDELRRLLIGRGVAVSDLAPGHAEAAAAVAVACADRRSECRAAAAWASERLARQPGARLGIVAIELGRVRDDLIEALDEVLHPEALLAANSGMPRRYNVSLGTALAREPIVAVALELTSLAAAGRRVDRARLSALITGPYWSNWQDEADARARLDAAMRRNLPPTLDLPSWLAFARVQRQRGLPIEGLQAAIEALVTAADGNSGRRLPSAWAEVFAELLDASGWPGGRSLSSREWQARTAFGETLQQLATFDAVLGRVPITDASRQLARLCRERVFQAETVGVPEVEVLGPLEASGLAFDAVWVLGANDDAWPPPPRPNPLLPAQLQRAAKSRHASAEVQLDFARHVQRRLLHSAPEVIFSWAGGDGDRQLRPSPLIAGLPEGDAPAAVKFLAGLVRRAGMEWLDDHLAPPVAEGESVAGGTALMRAQALCPAWAFYRYRLGARPLEEAGEGLDAADRGTLLHRVMERFFAGRTQAELVALGEEGRQRAIDAAVAGAVAAFEAERAAPLPTRFAAIERARLQRLLGQWLELELRRPVAFSVVACERKVAVVIEGIAIELKVDRIDQLAGGGRLVIDYKTGKPDTEGWQGDRLAEPQLPLYATQGDAEGVLFARVRPDDCGVIGWGADAAWIDGLKSVDWPQTLGHWRKCLAAIAGEVRSGHAAVSFDREDDLRYCEVLPLLRLPEVRGQRGRS